MLTKLHGSILLFGPIAVEAVPPLSQHHSPSRTLLSSTRSLSLLLRVQAPHLSGGTLLISSLRTRFRSRLRPTLFPGPLPRAPFQLPALFPGHTALLCTTASCCRGIILRPMSCPEGPPLAEVGVGMAAGHRGAGLLMEVLTVERDLCR